MLSLCSAENIIFTQNSREILVEYPKGLRPLGFSTQIFLSFVVNIYESASQISAYCSKLPSLYDTCPICLPMAPLLKYQYLGGKYDVLL